MNPLTPEQISALKSRANICAASHKGLTDKEEERRARLYIYALARARWPFLGVKKLLEAFRLPPETPAEFFALGDHAFWWHADIPRAVVFRLDKPTVKADNDPRGFTERLMGDPMPGRSALDQRRAQETPKPFLGEK